MGADDLTATLIELERRGWESLCRGTGGTVYGELMTADAVMVLANGAVMDRATVVESLEHAPPWRTFSIDNVRLLQLGEDAATLVYVGTAFGEAAEPAFVGVMSSVYRRSGDGWRLALYQQTPLPSDE